VESGCGAHFRSKTTYVSFCLHCVDVLYTCLCFVGVRVPWIVDLPFAWSVYAVVNEVLFILVRLFLISGLVGDFFICTKTEEGPPFEVTARSISVNFASVLGDCSSLNSLFSSVLCLL
jgi:hypothetical protein